MTERKAISTKRRFSILNRDNFTCAYCGQSAPSVVLQIDHIISVADGGSDEDDNLVTSCADCNQGKSSLSTMPPIPFGQSWHANTPPPSLKPEDYYQIPFGLFDSPAFARRGKEKFSKPAAWLWIVEKAAQSEDHRIYFTAQRLAEHWGWTRAKSATFLMSLANHRMVSLTRSYSGYQIEVVDKSHFSETWEAI